MSLPGKPDKSFRGLAKAMNRFGDWHCRGDVAETPFIGHLAVRLYVLLCDEHGELGADGALARVRIPEDFYALCSTQGLLQQSSSKGLVTRLSPTPSTR